MDKNKNCTMRNVKLDVVNYLKQTNVCKTFYYRNGRKNNNNTSHQNQKSKSSSHEVLELLEVLKSRISKSTISPRS